MAMLLAAAALAAISPSGPAVHSTARVAVRILAPAHASSTEWERAPRQSKRETLIRSETGERVLARLIEYQ